MKYEIINASDGVFSRPTGKNGDGMVQPNTRRVLEFDEEFSDRFIESSASGGVFIKKSTSAAQNGQPLPAFDEHIATTRRALMVAAGQEREDLVGELWAGKPGKATKAAAAASGGGTTATTVAPTSAPAPTASTGP